MWAPRKVDEWLRFHMKALARLGLHEWGGAVPPPVMVRTSYGRGRAVRLCWPLGPNLSTCFYCNDCHSDFPCALAVTSYPQKNVSSPSLSLPTLPTFKEWPPMVDMDQWTMLFLSLFTEKKKCVYDGHRIQCPKKTIPWTFS
ncbi:hypothetical protein AVEN_168555-1 [Araneus ventricosus]|uniref:Uncharacterized protein n=1 Tax=Araneus ventricosus TaxID=182803 RepID=A0A4Y2FPL7_ARAVE|nr:hypothetical protein AVEN_168555-1 [Araneus ventricosus]